MFIVNVEGAVRRGNKWLVIRRSSKETHAGGTLSLVGGKADEEGHALDILERTVKRELEEEVGIEVLDPVTFVYSSSFVTDDGRPVINVVFLCEHVRGSAYAKSADEVEDVLWLSFEDIVSHPDAPPWTKESIRRAAARAASF